MRRTEHDDVGRRVRSWVDGALDVDRAYTAQENAEADAAATTAARETNRAILLDRAQTAIAANLTALTTAQTIENQTSFNNAQRDDSLRFLARTVGSLLKENNALIRLVVGLVRAEALDSTE